MKNTGKMRRFRRIVRELVDDEDFDANRHRAMFLKVFILFKKSEGIKRRLSNKEHQDLWDVFIRTLRLEGIKVKEGFLDTEDSISTLIKERPRKNKGLSSIVTPAMRRGAYGAQLRHSGVLKHNG